MSTLENILSRMMNEHGFTDAVFTNAEKALVEYNLPLEEIELFKEISQADFEAFVAASPEERKSLAGQLSGGDLATWRTNFGNGI